MSRRPRLLRSRAAYALCAWLLAGLVVAPPGLPAAQAAPKGEKVRHGEASFARDGELTVIRPSDGAIIDYTSFDILRNETVRFDQPSSQARVLNRVSGDATRIDGALLANGIVYLVNPAGVFFGGDAVVRVGQLVAAAGDLPDRDFLSGVDAFSLTGPVENRGSLEGSAIALLGRSVANYGSIVAPDGVIALVAGEKVVLTELEGGIAVEVDGPQEGAETGILQSGLVDAGAGSAQFAVGDHYSLAINHAGVTRARDILLAGGADGLVRVSGTLDASAREPGQTGGSVRVTGDLVSLVGATLDASGAAGGGLVHVGGDVRGEGPLANARRTFVDQDSVLRVDALASGDGGSAVVFGEEAAGFLGRISARGGAGGGDGGFAELSSGGLLVDRGSVDLGASAGSAGTLLYDPQDIVLVGGTLDGSDLPDTAADALAQGGTAGQVLFADVGAAEPFAVYESELEGTDANIVLEARNSITASGTFDHDAGGEGAGVVAIHSGRDLTLRTSNQAGEETGSSMAPGIDLTGSAHGADLELRASGGGTLTIATGTGTNDGPEAPIAVGVLTTVGGAISLLTEDGSVSLARATTSGMGGSAGGNGANIVIDAGDKDGSGDTAVLVTGDLTARGGDATTGRGGNGGSVGVRTRAAESPATGGGGPVTLMGSIDVSGGSGPAGGGKGGTVVLHTAVHGDLSAGAITSRGGDAPGPTVVGNGGFAGPVSIDTDDGDIAVGAIDTRGGTPDGAQVEFGGNGGDVTIFAGRDQAGSGNLTLNGNLNAQGGSGPPGMDLPLFGGNFDLRAHGDIEVGGQVGPHITTEGSVVFNAFNVGALTPIQVSGGPGPTGLLGLGADDVARVEIDDGTFDDIQVVAFGPAADIEVREGGAPIVRILSSELLLADSSAHGANLVLGLQDRLEGADDAPTPLVFTLDTGSITAGGNVRVLSEDDIALGNSAGTVAVMNALPPDPLDPSAPSVSGTLTLIADSDNDHTGAIRNGVTGARLNLLGNAEQAGGLIGISAEGIGASGDPITTVGGGPLALRNTESGDIFLRNEGSGSTTVARLSAPGVPPQAGVTLAGPGEIVLENAAGDLVLEEPVSASGEAGAGGAVTLDAAPGSRIVLAVDRNRVTIDANQTLAFGGDVTLMEDSRIASRQGDVLFPGSIDTDAARGDRVRSLLVQARLPDPGATIPVTAGEIHLAGDVGVANDVRDLALTGDVVLEGGVREMDVTNHLLFFGDVRVDSDDAAGLSILAGPRVEFHGDVGAPGARLSGLSIARNTTPPFSAELPDPFVLFAKAGDQQVLTGAGGIEIVPAGLMEIPDKAMIAKLDGGLTLQSTGGSVNMGQNEKLTVQGAANLIGDTVEMGDVSALELHVDSPDARVRARAPASVLTRSGGRARDKGTDLIANTVDFTSAPSVEGTGPAPRIATQSGQATNAGALQVLAFNGSIAPDDLVRGSTVLDLAIRPQDLPNEVPQQPPWMEGLVEPRPGDTAAAGSALPPGAQETLAYLRCSSERRQGCYAAPDSPLASPRGAELASESARLLGDSASARELRAGLARLEPGALRELAVFLTEIRLLGLSDAEYRVVRDAVYREILADRGPSAPAPDAFAAAVEAQARGVPL